MDILHFNMEGIDYGCQLEDVDQILHMASIQPIAHGPDFLAGMFNLGGKLLPVVDLCKMLGHSRDLPPPPTSTHEEVLSPYKQDCRLILVKLAGCDPDDSQAPEKIIAVILDGWQGLRETDQSEFQPCLVSDDERPDFIHNLSLSENKTMQFIQLKYLLNARQQSVLI